ncbi:MAG: hypothetical protein ACRCVN_02000 [Spirochaetia bacterium]
MQLFKDIEQDIIPVIQAMGYQLVEFSANMTKRTVFITLYVYKNSGLGSDDCDQIILALRPRIETMLHPHDLALSVSSPGVNRTLKSAAEYPVFIGKKLRVILQGGHTFEGILTHADEKEIQLGDQKYPYDQIAKSKLI